MDNVKLTELIRLLCSREIKVPDNLVEQQWHGVMHRSNILRSILRRRNVRIGAAAIATGIVFLAGALMFFSRQQGQLLPAEDIEFYALHTAPASETDFTGNTRLRVKESEEIEVSATRANFDYSSGSIVSDADTIARGASSAPGQYNQLIVPCGKHASLKLNDGTVIHVNSHSRVVYPADFRVGNREIFLEGEAYFDVAHDANRPLTVHTSRCKVCVLGTAFNVCAYPSAKSDDIALARGSVRVEQHNSRRTLSPGQLVSAGENSLSDVANVDISQYTCWMNNYLICNNKQLDEIFDRLHYIYGVDFVTPDGLQNIKISGKLDLRESLVDVLDILNYSIPLNFTQKGNTVNVTRRNV